MVSQHLVEQWRTRLADWQQRLDEGRPRPWLARAYVRVLSFLLAQYGATVDAASPIETGDAGWESDDRAEHRSRMKLAVTMPEISGKPPRTTTQIRLVLHSVARSVTGSSPNRP